MDIRALKLFLHLSSSLHYGQTSYACNITRSGLTRTIQRLEQELGEQLFFRDNRSVTLTRAGALFREYATDVINRHRTLTMDLAAENAVRGELSLYCSVTAILSILPGIITTFRQTYPGVILKLQTGDAAMALPRLESGEADIAIAALPDLLPRPTIFLKLLETPLIFIGPRDPQASGLAESLDHWERLPLIIPARGLSKTRCEQWFADKQLLPTIYSSVAGNEAMIAMVAMGCGIGVVPQLVLDHSPLKDTITILDAEPCLQPFTVGCCTTISSHRNPIIQAFWQIAEQRTALQPKPSIADENYPYN